MIGMGLMGLIRPMGQRGRVYAPALEGSLAEGCIVGTDWRSGDRRDPL